MSRRVRTWRAPLVAVMLVLGGVPIAARPLALEDAVGGTASLASQQQHRRHLHHRRQEQPLLLERQQQPQQQQEPHGRRLHRAAALVGGDDLTEVVSPLPYPYSALGLLVFSNDAAPPPGAADEGAEASADDAPPAAGHGRDVSICTGFMVSPDTVLTAAHCLFNVPSEASPGRPLGFRRVVGFYPSYSRAAGGAAGRAPLGRVAALWTDVPPEWKESAREGVFWWRGDYGAVRLAKPVGHTTGWFGLASGCDVAASALTGSAKERAGGASTAAASTSVGVAGFPGANIVSSASGRLLFPLMGDSGCRMGLQNLCPADAASPDRRAGMLHHQCDTSKGMSGSPLWLPPASAAGGAAASEAAAAGFPGVAGAGASSDADGAAPGPAPAVVVGLVSRHVGDCPWGADCENLAAPMDRRALSLAREWIARA